MARPSIPETVVLEDVFGTGRCSGGWRFIPAAFDLRDGAEWEVSVPVVGDSGDIEDGDGSPCGAELPPALACVRDALLPGATASEFVPLWTRARLPAVFGVAPQTGNENSRWALFELGFLAVRTNDAADARVMPMLCVGDVGSGAMLLFEESVPPPVRRELTNAFWDLLLARPHDLSSFSTVYETEYGVVNVGLDARGFFDDSQEDDDVCDAPRQGYDPHLAALRDAERTCPECGGSGEESFCPCGEMCGFCDGAGTVSPTHSVANEDE